jgi:hypothetical protein
MGPRGWSCSRRPPTLAGCMRARARGRGPWLARTAQPAGSLHGEGQHGRLCTRWGAAGGDGGDGGGAVSNIRVCSVHVAAWAWLQRVAALTRIEAPDQRLPSPPTQRALQAGPPQPALALAGPPRDAKFTQAFPLAVPCPTTPHLDPSPTPTPRRTRPPTRAPSTPVRRAMGALTAHTAAAGPV